MTKQLPVNPSDPVALTAALIRCHTVTPAEGGALVLLEQALGAAGFACHRVDRAGTPNLFARLGPKGAARSFGFNGHTDVVPTGPEASWRFGPFSAQEAEGRLWGRGATDMKSGVAAFVAAAVDFASQMAADDAIIIAITGDEEGPAHDGTLALLDWMRANGEAMSVCIVGEPTSRAVLGDMMKIGRRGSMNVSITLNGQQGHAAYPHMARNPVPAMAQLIDRLSRAELDKGSDHFDPSTLAAVTIDTGNPATNVIPAQCKAGVNIRFNDHHSGASLTAWVEEQALDVAQAFGIEAKLDISISGEWFLTPPGSLSALIGEAVKAETGLEAVQSTSGGTSDARFIKDHCPVVEFGLAGLTMHQIDENVLIAEIETLKTIYGKVLRGYFA
ncbi:MAG: succinyl-diaminopimelate desuccinylase [Rhodobacteraceae bacterium]|nr:succinyl-diaminopimelate desuccinylase [Paracoccaceae bacterium]